MLARQFNRQSDATDGGNQKFRRVQNTEYRLGKFQRVQNTEAGRCEVSKGTEYRWGKL